MDAETSNLLTIGLNAVAAFAAAASAIGAFWTIKRATSIANSQQKAADTARANERLLDHAVITLERAYSAFAGNSPDSNPPPDSRVGWLTAARLLLEYKNAKARMTDPLLIQECDSHEDHWRLKFYLKLSTIERDRTYYTQAARIEKTSAVIITAFSEWPEGKPDPIDVYDSARDAMSKLKLNLRRSHPLRWYVDPVNMPGTEPQD
ncbi:hypothetical protein [Pseudomonas sp. PDM19]|uniref:hypothetical protein n=1 Tax=Pseudomonas sp. PDM19 TaxID=2769272 RepID=UPI00177D5D1E|nr:hypothetical protein [Pseudomonas sp. PDM19]MBD9629748.1 hypothetical protein [Pseudomonas sp. PDM19]